MRKARHPSSHSATRYGVPHESAWDVYGVMRIFLFAVLKLMAFIVVSVVGGWYLTCLIDMLPMNMPASVEAFLNFCVDVTGHSIHKHNPDDMKRVALLFYWIVSAMFVGALVLFSSYSLQRRRHRRST
jgi:F0F1-type ATP synthase membrane subunit a